MVLTVSLHKSQFEPFTYNVEFSAMLFLKFILFFSVTVELNVLYFTFEFFAIVAIPVNVFPAMKLSCAPLNSAPRFNVLFI